MVWFWRFDPKNQPMNIIENAFDSGIMFAASIFGKLIATLIPLYFIKRVIEDYKESQYSFFEFTLTIVIFILTILYSFKVPYIYLIIIILIFILLISLTYKFFLMAISNKHQFIKYLTPLYFLGFAFIYSQSLIIAGGYIPIPSIYYIFFLVLIMPYFIYLLIFKSVTKLTSILYSLFVFSLYLYLCTVIGLTKQ